MPLSRFIANYGQIIGKVSKSMILDCDSDSGIWRISHGYNRLGAILELIVRSLFHHAPIDALLCCLPEKRMVRLLGSGQLRRRVLSCALLRWYLSPAAMMVSANKECARAPTWFFVWRRSCRVGAWVVGVIIHDASEPVSRARLVVFARRFRSVQCVRLKLEINHAKLRTYVNQYLSETPNSKRKLAGPN